MDTNNTGTDASINTDAGVVTNTDASMGISAGIDAAISAVINAVTNAATNAVGQGEFPPGALSLDG